MKRIIRLSMLTIAIGCLSSVVVLLRKDPNGTDDKMQVFAAFLTILGIAALVYLFVFSRDL
jgi:hypothetical protein